MNRKKIVSTIAISCIVVGFALMLAMYLASGCDWESFSTTNYEEKTYAVDSTFDSICIDESSSTVEVKYTDSGKCTVVCSESEDLTHTIEVRDGVLCVSVNDDRKWTDMIGINIKEPHVIVSLPEKEYKKLTIETKSGEIDEIKKVSFEEVCLTSKSGDITLQSTSFRALTANSASGHIELKDISVSGSLQLETKSGDIELTDTLVGAELDLTTKSGSVEINDGDCSTGSIETKSGEVDVTLKTEKTLVIDTKSGDVDAPKGTEGEIFRVTTKSGSVEVDFD